MQINDCIRDALISTHSITPGQLNDMLFEFFKTPAVPPTPSAFEDYSMTIGNNASTLWGYHAGIPFGDLDHYTCFGNSVWSFAVNTSGNIVIVNINGQPTGINTIRWDFGGVNVIDLPWGGSNYNLASAAFTNYVIAQNGNTLPTTLTKFNYDLTVGSSGNNHGYYGPSPYGNLVPLTIGGVEINYLLGVLSDKRVAVNLIDNAQLPGVDSIYISMGGYELVLPWAGYLYQIVDTTMADYIIANLGNTIPVYLEPIVTAPAVEGDTLSDVERNWLIAKGATPGQINDMWMEYMISEGITSGSLNDRLHEWWCAQVPAPPAPAEILTDDDDVVLTDDLDVPLTV